MMIPEMVIRPRKDRPNTPWGVFWTERQGSTLKKRARLFRTEAEAQAFRRATLAGLAAAKIPVPPTVPTTPGTLAAYLHTWLRDVIKPHREAATYLSYEQVVRLHVVPVIGSRRMRDLGPLLLRKFYGDLFDRGVSLGLRWHIHRTLRSAFGQAVIDEVLDRNPCAHLGKIIRHKTESALKVEPNPLTRDEAARLLADIAAHYPVYTELLQFLHDTGVRIGEAAALKWTSVEFDRARAHITASYSPAERADKLPKTNKTRWIELTDLVMQQLQAWRQRQRVESLRRGRSVPAYVFTNRAGHPMRFGGNMRRAFREAAARCDLGRRTPHDLRDTFATTHLCDDFRRLPWVSRQLGHASERTTLDHYFRFLPSDTSSQFANQIR